MQASIRLNRPKGANANIVTIISLQVIPCISCENAGLRIRGSPVSSDVKNLTREAWACGVAAHYWDRAPDPHGAFAERVI
jgi:hypothetical protein